MHEQIRVKRLWSMGQFNNVELESTISEIPEKIALNDRAIGLLYNLMLLEAESAHKEYIKLYRDNPILLNVFPEIVKYIDESLKIIKEDKSRTFDELIKELNQSGS